MGFLDHSTNNIIVDAVLTDAGRKRLSELGTASNSAATFISNYSFADDEVDYNSLEEALTSW